jgi:hypothetical protein
MNGNAEFVRTSNMNDSKLEAANSCHEIRNPIIANTASITDRVFSREIFSHNIALRSFSDVSYKKEKEQLMLTLVSERMASANENFSDAWNRIKFCHPTLFEIETYRNLER